MPSAYFFLLPFFFSLAVTSFSILGFLHGDLPLESSHLHIQQHKILHPSSSSSSNPPPPSRLPPCSLSSSAGNEQCPRRSVSRRIMRTATNSRQQSSPGASGMRPKRNPRGRITTTTAKLRRRSTSRWREQKVKVSRLSSPPHS